MTAVHHSRTLAECEPFSRSVAWVLWRLEAPRRPGGKPVKVPIHHDASRRHSLKDPAPLLDVAMAQQWLAYLRAVGAGHDRPGEVGYVGLGFRPDGLQLACVDVDNCIQGGAWSPAAQEMMAAFPGALVELSTSGQGLHIWFTYAGEGPGIRARDRSGRIEMYSAVQFVALGRVLQGDARTDHTAAMHHVLSTYWPPVASERTPLEQDWDEKDQLERAKVLHELSQTLGHLPQASYQDWVRIGCALKSLDDDGYTLWHQFSSLHPDYDEAECDQKWLQLRADRTDYRALFAEAQRNGWVNPASTEARVAGALSGFGAPALNGHHAAPVAPVVPAAPVPAAPMAFQAADGGLITASSANVQSALMSNQAGMQVSRDEFRAALMIQSGGVIREFEDEDYTAIRVALERGGFKPVSSEVVKSGVKLAARVAKFDSAKDWATTLRWDGVPRVTMAMHRYYGCADTPYTRAVAEYLFSALADRAMNPGCQADMVPVLVGTQGLSKTSAVAALAPREDMFVEVNLAKRDDDLARRLRGKLVAELAELRGLGTKEVEGIRAWITRRHEEWVPKYEEATRKFGRRFLAIGTVNGDEFLDDPEGERRWLPVRVAQAGPIDLEGLRRDCEQLWAEGMRMVANGGQRWQEAQRLGMLEVQNFKVRDPWQAHIAGWLERPPAPMMLAAHPGAFGAQRVGEIEFSTRDVLSYCLHISPERQGRGEAQRVRKVLRGMGWAEYGPDKIWRQHP